jgi:uncharacterized protein (DUF1330 family)
MTTIHTTSEQRAAIQAADDGRPIAIVNLLKFHDQAQYPAGSAEAAEGLTGRDAYRRYVAGWVALIAEFGGEQVYWGDTVGYMIGDGPWDAVWINRFPSFAAVTAAASDPRYAALAVHRKAGLACQEALVNRLEPPAPE